jgi:hypothetical protein
MALFDCYCLFAATERKPVYLEGLAVGQKIVCKISEKIEKIEFLEE